MGDNSKKTRNILEVEFESSIEYHGFKIIVEPDPSYVQSDSPDDRGQTYCYEILDPDGKQIDKECGFCADETDIAIFRARAHINYIYANKVLNIIDKSLVKDCAIQNALNILEGAKVMHYYAQLPEEGLALLQEVEDELRRVLPQS